jgi:hypothetical protein
MSGFELSRQTSHLMTIVKQNGELKIRGIKRKITMVIFILLNNVTTDTESVHHFVISTNEPFV